ncbi:HAD family hydrolase [Plantibacter sp. Mn2098]|uniref:HAD family hydrolase n=1 Tax=Plantibacter sp. Mn2098 TaxID=3395266 RepID=UPI003BBC6623
MPISIPGRVVVFDYGEVISVTPVQADRDAILAIADVDAELFWPPYWHHRDALDLGSLSIVDYWNTIREEVGASWSDATIQRLWIADFRSWLSINTEVFDAIAELHAGGTRLAILSNAGTDFGGFYRHGPLSRFFERVFVSAEMDLVKPDPAIYIETIHALGITADQFVFIDNRVENVEAAIAVGGTAHHFTGAAGMRDFLMGLSQTP